MVPRLVGNVRCRLGNLGRSDKDGVIQLLSQGTHVVLQREAAEVGKYVHDPVLCHSSFHF
ncbi:hypothetical protein [Tropicimonas sp. S265A]|uniref:hypothetical protein n=1 Tax=Tropicimonas sp. S265A TaxID=3415134 RepID=UPI003C7B371C